jgi:hypothetical protein
MPAGYADVDDGSIGGCRGLGHAWLLNRRHPCRSAGAIAPTPGA